MHAPNQTSNEASHSHQSLHCAHADPRTCRYHSLKNTKGIGYAILVFFQRPFKISETAAITPKEAEQSYRDPTGRSTTCNHAFMTAHELRGASELCDLCRKSVYWIWTCSYCTRFLCNPCKRVRVDTIDDD